MRRRTKTEKRKEAEAFLAKLKRDAHEQGQLEISPPRTRQQAAVRYLSVKATLGGSIEHVRRICCKLDPHFGKLTLNQIIGDGIWSVVGIPR